VGESPRCLAVETEKTHKTSQDLIPESPKYRWATNFGSRTWQKERLNIFAKVTANLTKAGLQHSIKLRIRLHCSTTTTRYTTVPRPHWRSRLDATWTPKYCQKVLEITNDVRDLRFLQRSSTEASRVGCYIMSTSK